MKRTMTILMALALGVGATCGASAQPSLRTLDNFQVTSLSADGRAAAGVLPGNLETARWSDDLPDTVIALGRDTWTTVGNWAGKVDISADGLRVSATVATDDSLMTWGMWSKGTGWILAMPPLGPGGVVSDRAYGSCWGLSGDGLTVAGMYWTAGSIGQAGTWTEAGGVVALASPAQSRPNGLNHDGSVVTGWAYLAGETYRKPAVWEDGTLTMLATTLGEGYDVAADGNTLLGQVYDQDTGLMTAALWTRGTGTWNLQLLGTLPGTQPGYGSSRAESIANDGSVVVGFNQFGGFSKAGIVWTPTLGLMKADDFVTDVLGLALPAGYTITNMTAVSSDTRVLAGYGNNPYDLAQPIKSFLIDTGGLSAVPGAPGSDGLAIAGNHPNPFNPTTDIRLSVARDTRVRLEIFDVRGRLVRLLHDGDLAAGDHVLTWQGRDDGGRAVGSGVYLARARSADGRTASLRMTLLK